MTNQCFKPFREKIIFALTLLTFCFGWTLMSHASAFVSIQSDTLEVPKIGEHLTMDVNITGGKTVAGYQFTAAFDPSALRYIVATNADYLAADTFAMPLPRSRQRHARRDRTERRAPV